MTESAAQTYEEYQYRRWLEDPVDLGKRMRDALGLTRQEPVLTYSTDLLAAAASDPVADPHGSWPKDMAHEHARALVKEGVKKLSSAARKVLRAELDKADAPLTGRSAQDAAIGGIGRALTGGMTRYGLRTGA